MRLSSIVLAAPLAAAGSFQHGVNTAAHNTEVSYDGYHIYSITPSSTQEARDIGKRFSNHHTHPIRNTLSVAIPPEDVESFEALGLKARLVNADLGSYIRSTDRDAVYERGLHRPGKLPDLSWFNTYHPYADHLQYWDDLIKAFSKNSRKFPIGKSYENRTIWAFNLHGDKKKGHGKHEENKPVILWHATVHAREWISTMGKLYILYKVRLSRLMIPSSH
jgi:hypothetical protein